jgi:hypothetical protein
MLQDMAYGGSLGTSLFVNVGLGIYKIWSWSPLTSV